MYLKWKNKTIIIIIIISWEATFAIIASNC